MNGYESMSARLVSSSRSRWARAAFMSAGLCVTAVASAAPRSLNATQRPNETSSFTLDFGVFGGPRQANITSTQFQLEVDDAAGTARFVTYTQQVDPLLLPGDISTGNITVQIVPGSSTGIYFPDTGRFETEELYEIHFDGDLSAYGLVSPVYLPSESFGSVTFSGPRFGRISLDWDGAGALANPFAPGEFISFSYLCEVEASFGLRAITPDAEPSDAELRAAAPSRSVRAIRREEAAKEETIAEQAPGAE